MPERAPDERTLRVAAAAAAVGADWTLLCAPETVCYASGFAQNIETGPLPFAGGPPVALVSREGFCALLVANIEHDAASAGYAQLVRSYAGFTAVGQPPWRKNYLDAVRALLAGVGAGGRLAVEPGSLPFELGVALAEQFEVLIDIDPALRHARAEKTPAELAALSFAARVASAGQREAVLATQPGVTELEAFARIRAAMEIAADARLPMQGDYISGVERTAEGEGWPNSRVMAESDPVICDLSPRVGGYWGDSCDTLFIGSPEPGFIELYRIAERAIAQAAESVRPGVPADTVAREVDAVIKASGFDNPLHIGHGTGTSFHEWPRIVRGEEAILRPGMVLMIEPGVYHPERGGVRLEHMFEVTETGNRILTAFEFALDGAL